MKKGVVFLKPDFFEYGEEIKKLLYDLIDRNKLKLVNFYEIKNYGEFCERYRLFDIANSDYTSEEMQQEIKRTSYATFVYKNLFKEKPAMALVFSSNDADCLYAQMSNLKSNVRAYIKNNKTKDYFVDISDKWKAFEYYNGCGLSQEYIDSKMVKLAYLNGIHLEERALFNKDICYKFLKKKKIINEGGQRKDEEKDI